MERVAIEASKNAQGPILLISSGSSQSPSGKKLTGGNGEIVGLGGPFRRSFPDEAFPTKRTLLITVYTLEDSFVGGSSRSTPLTPDDSTQDADRQKRTETKESNANPVQWPHLLLAGVIGAGLSFVGMRLRKKPVPAIPTNDASVELEAFRSESKRILKQLDISAQELAESTSELGRTQSSELVDVRSEAIALTSSLARWDDIAMTFVESLYRMRSFHSSDPQKLEVIETLLRQFGKLAQQTGLDIISPAPGEVFQGSFHRVIDSVQADSVEESGQITELVSPGFRRGSEILRPASINIKE